MHDGDHSRAPDTVCAPVFDHTRSTAFCDLGFLTFSVHWGSTSQSRKVLGAGSILGPDTAVGAASSTILSLSSCGTTPALAWSPSTWTAHSPGAEGELWAPSQEDGGVHMGGGGRRPRSAQGWHQGHAPAVSAGAPPPPAACLWRQANQSPQF